ncbi:MAG: phosphoribosylformylglycinamidine synthase [Candidatus Izemoplasmatales bacterium]|nr:phosphoribosylformylglycinamidine synthase [Candidatus Izemoplasmatales bacterium]
MSPIRLFVEKKLEFALEAESLRNQIADDLDICLRNFRRVLIYDLFDCDVDDIDILKWQVFGEKATDQFLKQVPLVENGYLAFAYLPGQFDQKADSAQECIQLILGKKEAVVLSKTVYLFDPISTTDLDRLKKYIINPVDSWEVDLTTIPAIPPVNSEKATPIIKGFILWGKEQRQRFHQDMALAMSIADLELIAQYFQKENRDPSETEIRVLDTYWSDHCRHTTFETVLEPIRFEATEPSHPLLGAFQLVQTLRQDLKREEQPMTLMELATIYARWVRKTNPNHAIEISNEVNAASIVVQDKSEEYLIMFKNETHNHPTEIEPFGGASTCLGGAIRDPLSGRSFVYQGLRVSGAGNVLARVKDTLPGKLPQRVITKKATLGFSSYGNQIGLATTYVRELFHPGYVAKRMEVGAVVGAVKRKDIQRGTPVPGDWVILIGGKTGRDGIGGATGSSKSHTDRSLETSGSEVQKGNAPIERQLQRLFRHPEVTRIVKKCNDFGAGGVAVAIGELAEGVRIDLDQLPTKYQGLSATELAISESQERMALVIDPADYPLFEHVAEEENLEAVHVADVTTKKRLVMIKSNQVVVDLDRSFMNTNGVRQTRMVFVKDTLRKKSESSSNPLQNKDTLLEWLSMPSHAIQKGMIEHFDSTIGRTSIFLPFGGKTQMTEVDASVQKLPFTESDSSLVTIMTVGGNPDCLSESPYRGAYLAVVEALAKAMAVGGDIRRTHLSLQEYFQRLGTNPENWGNVFQALLGALQAQADFEVPAIGGKDSMSGSFLDLHVPPTLLAFALTIGDIDHLVSPEFKAPGHRVYLFQPSLNGFGLPDSTEIKRVYQKILDLIQKKRIQALAAIKAGGWVEAVAKMSYGNWIGCRIEATAPLDCWDKPFYGGLVIESDTSLNDRDFQSIGLTTEIPTLQFPSFEVSLSGLLQSSLETFSELFPCSEKVESQNLEIPLSSVNWIRPGSASYRPKVFIPAFPGTNCELDSEAAFRLAGADPVISVFRNQTKEAIQSSIDDITRVLDQSDILMLPGGFSAGDEPDGSGKYITAVLLNPYVKAAIHRFLSRKGLILGICNGFQALIKSGLLPWGVIGEIGQDYPTLAKNKVGRHIATMIRTKVITNASPWFYDFSPGEIHTMPVSHGEGRFMASQATLERLIQEHQIATQYVNLQGQPTMSLPDNPNGSMMAIEGLLSPDGLILGKMGHSERDGVGLYQNYPLYKPQKLFESVVHYLKKR